MRSRLLPREALAARLRASAEAVRTGEAGEADARSLEALARLVERLPAGALDAAWRSLAAEAADREIAAGATVVRLPVGRRKC